jgi:hypothetical protein
LVTQYRVHEPALRLAADLALDKGDRADAAKWLDAHNALLARCAAVVGQSENQGLWSRYFRVTGDTERAYAHAEGAFRHATEPRQPLALLAAQRLLGELDTESERYDDAAAHLNESLALAEVCQAPYERALTLLAMAELRAAQGQHVEARTLLDEVRAICEPLGAKPTLARAAALAVRLPPAP